MKLGEDVLVELISIVQSGLLRRGDVSQQLRDIDVVERDGKVYLSDEYLVERNRKKI